MQAFQLANNGHFMIGIQMYSVRRLLLLKLETQVIPSEGDFVVRGIRVNTFYLPETS